VRRVGLAAVLTLVLCAAGAQDVVYLPKASFSFPPKDAAVTVQEAADVDAAPDGSIHVVDRKGAVVVFTQGGTPQRSYAVDARSQPIAIAIGPDGSAYVLDRKSKSVTVFAPDGQPRGSFGGPGDRGGKFNNPLDITLGTGGLVYVLDAGRRSIQVFTLEGLFIREVQSPTRFGEPAALAVAPDGTMFVSDRKTPGLFHQVPPFDRIPWRVEVPDRMVQGVTIEGGALEDVVSMDVNANGTVLLLDRARGKVVRRRPAETVDTNRNDVIYGGLGTTFGSFMKATALAFAGVDEVVVLDAELRKVERIRLEGEASLPPMPAMESAIRVTFGNPRTLPGVIAALDCDSTGVLRFFFETDRKAVVSRRAKRTSFMTAYGDSATGFEPDPSASELSYGRTLSSVGGVAVRDTIVVVTDPDKDRFVVLRNGAGTVIETVGDGYRDERRLRSPQGIAVTPSGRVALADLGKGCIRVFSPDRASVLSCPFPKAFGIAADAQENLYAWAKDGAGLSRFTKGSRQGEVLGSSIYPSRIGGLSFDPAGNAVALDLTSHQIMLIGRDGKQLLFAFGPEGGYEDPCGVLVDPSGNIYVPDRGLKQTFVYRWAVTLPPPMSCRVAYGGAGVALAWDAIASHYVWGYEVRGVDAAGRTSTLGRTRSSEYAIPVPDVSSEAPQSVRVATVSVSGATGPAGAPLQLPGLAALAAFRRGDQIAAVRMADEALDQLSMGEQFAADSAGTASFHMILFLDAINRAEYERAVRVGLELKDAVPPAFKQSYYRKMAEAYLALDRPAGAATQLIACANCAPTAGALADSGLVQLTFRVFDAALAGRDTTGAFGFLRSYTDHIPESETSLHALYEQHLQVMVTRMKLGRGFDLWRNLEYEAAIRFFEKVLTMSGSTLDVPERVLSYQILAAACYVFGRKDDAKTEFMKIFVLQPDYDMRREVDNAQRLYDIVIFNNEMIRFFENLGSRSEDGQ